MRKLLDAIRQSLWFVPAVWAAACGAAALGMVALDRAIPDLASDVPFVFGGGPEGARGVLSAIAGSMITVVGVVFSITIVALQLASSQYSPRVLRNFMRDRASQITLGSFIGVFVYSLLVLRTVRTDANGREEFVPVLAVTGAVLLAVIAVAMLIYFIHHIATRMQASYITAAVASETLDEIDRQAGARPDQPGEDRPSPGDALPERSGTVVSADKSGYLQYVEADSLTQLAEQHDLVIRLEIAPGAWVQRHAPLFEVWGLGLEAVDANLSDHVSVGDERVVFQDVEFGIQQLADIAVKALSPGINDPTTARNALHRIVEILVAAGRAKPTPAEHFDKRRRLRLSMPRADFAQLLRTAFEEIHHFGRDIPPVSRAIGEALDTVELAVDGQHRATIAEIRREIGRRSGSTPDTGS
ncbi:MAG: DUF2254 domain-containing protein [Chloroflexi bacterium]|nr:DUF2254 domain-containing protein [Chloroflexota bacterium]